MSRLLLCFLVVISIGCGARPGTKSAGGDAVRRVCLEGLDLHLGDSREEVERQLSLMHNPEGAAAVGEPGEHFVTTAGPTYPIEGGTLRSRIYTHFASNDQLRTVTVGWSFDGQRTKETMKAVVTALIDHIHPCIRNAVVDHGDGTFTARIDYGTYSESFRFVPDANWLISYTIKSEP